MSWFIFALSAAFFEAVKDVFGKKSLKQSDEYVVAWSFSFFSALFLIPIVLFVGIPPLNLQFWFALIASGSLNAVATLLYIKAIKSSDLSLTVPMVALTPLFMLVTSPLLVGEWPNLIDYLGIFFIVTGSYLLNIKESNKGYFAPFQALMQQQGPRFMLAVAFLWSITSNCDKIGIQNSSPFFWLFSVFSAISCCLLPTLLYKTPNPSAKILKNLPVLMTMGFVNVLGVSGQMQALTLALVVQVIAIKRTSVLMGVLLGYLIFREKNIKERFLGATTMLIGVILITL